MVLLLIPNSPLARYRVRSRAACNKTYRRRIALLSRCWRSIYRVALVGVLWLAALALCSRRPRRVTS